MVSNLYLNDFLYPLCKSYGGCFSCDNVPSVKVGQSINFIINLSKESEPGTHFIALIIKEHTVFYFDSFGLKCSNRDILTYMENLSRKIVFNSFTIQDVNSKMCGYYCALLILRNDKNCKLKSDLYFYSSSKDLVLNDKLCVDYICGTIAHIKK